MIGIIQFAIVYIAIMLTIAIFHMVIRLDKIIELLQDDCEYECSSCKSEYCPYENKEEE